MGLAQRLRHLVLNGRQLAVVARLLPQLDTWLLRLTGGRFTLTSGTDRVLLLTTLGRRSGTPRCTPVIYTRDHDGYWVVASNWGRPYPPAWLHNLRSLPTVRIQVGHVHQVVTAMVLSDAERAVVWPRLVHAWPLYAELAGLAGNMPVVRLSPVSSTDAKRGRHRAERSRPRS